MTPTPYDPPPELETVQRRCLLIGIGGMVVCIIGLFFSPAQFFRSYLLGYVFWIGIALGCLAIVMVHHLSGGAWGLVIRRLLESGTRTLPLMFLLFIPIALGRAEHLQLGRQRQCRRKRALAAQAPLSQYCVLSRSALSFISPRGWL